MNQEQENSWSIPQRQPVSGLVVAMLRAVLLILKSFWPILILVVFREQKPGLGTMEIILISIPGLIILRAIADFFYLRFSIQNGRLLIKKGFIQKKEITIPLERIHGVDLEQNVFHRLLNISRVKIDTAGSEKTEAIIDAIENEKAAALKSFLLAEQRPSENNIEQEKPSGRIINQPGAADLLKMGLSANHFQAMLIIFAFAVSALQNLEEIFGPRIIEFVQESSSALSYTLNILILLMLLVLMISVVVSLVKTLLQYANFSMTETARGFQIAWGLLNNRQNLVPYNKVQHLSWSANWIRRKIGLYYFSFHQASRDVRGKERIKIPLASEEAITPILKHYHADIRKNDHSVHRMSSRYPWRRALIPGIPVTALAIALGYIWLGQQAFWAALYLPYEFLTAWVFRKNFRIYIGPDALLRESGVWGRKYIFMQWAKVQETALDQSLYQQGRGLADVQLSTAGGILLLPYIDQDLAWKIYNYALFRAEGGQMNDPINPQPAMATQV